VKRPRLLRLATMIISMLLLLPSACTPPAGFAPAGRATPETPPPAGAPTTPVSASSQVTAPESGPTPAAPEESLAAPVVASGPSYDPEIEARIAAVVSDLIPALYLAGDDPAAAPSGQPFDLAARMAYYAAPGVSIAVVQDGRLEWARGFGVPDAVAGYPVTPDTLFQAASISKPLTAIGALALVRAGRLVLDEPIDPRLSSWRIPGDASVTLRQALAHTAGFNVSGFPGYTPDDRLPSLLQILNGEAPANTPAIRAGAPGQYAYSGGGYVVVQQLLADVTGEPFESFMKSAVLAPLGMSASNFYQPLMMEFPGDRAAGHTFDRRPLPGGFNTYPELAAAGLWSTPAELAEVLIEIDAAAQGRGRLMSQALALDLLTPVTPGRGMGLILPGAVGPLQPGEARLFGHGGSNRGYRAMLFAVAGRGQGAVVMVNSDNGLELIFEIFRAIRRVYGWPAQPAWRAVERRPLTPIDVDPSGFPAYAGRYRLGKLTFTILAAGERLFLQLPAGSGPKYRLYPTGPDAFTSLDQAKFTFQRDAAGNIVGLTTNAWDERDQQAVR